MSQAEITAITPIVPLADLGKGVRFFRERLGFEVLFEGGDLALLRLGQGTVRLIAQGGSHVNMPNPAGELGIYIDVTGLDALFGDLALDGTEHRAPFDQLYGQREFHVWFENLQIIFGEPGAT